MSEAHSARPQVSSTMAAVRSMPRIAVADLLALALTVGVVYLLSHAVALPGKLAVACFVLAMATTLNHPHSARPRQYLLMGYMCLLLELIWQIVANFSIISPGTNSAADVFEPVTAAAGLSARALVPLLIAACVVIAIRSRPWRPQRATALFCLIILTTASVLGCYACFYATFHYGIPLYHKRVTPLPPLFDF